jgi:hypothetical protein
MDWQAKGIVLAIASISAMVCSVAAMVLPSGAFMTMIPF